jgi:subtilase family serine protease
MLKMRILSVLMAGAASLALSATAQAGLPIPNSAIVTATPASQVVEFSVYLPLQNKSGMDALAAAQQNPKSSSYRKWLTPAQFAAQFGPSQADLNSAAAALKAKGFTVRGIVGRAVEVSGTAAQFASSFGTSLSTVALKGHSHLVANATPKLPTTLTSLGASLPAFTSIPRLAPKLTPPIIASYNPNNRYSPVGGYWYDDLKQAYDYPSYQSLDGTGVNVAIVISSDVLTSDEAAMFNHEKFTATTGKAPPVSTTVDVDGGAPFSPESDGSFEASLDVQQVLGGAPGAAVTIVDIPDLSDDHILDGYSYIVNASNTSGSAQYQLVNSSFGGCELYYAPAYNSGEDFSFILDIYNEIFEQGNMEGITFVASSGDSGGLGCVDTNYFAGPFYGVTQPAPSRFIKGVEFPGSSPYVTAVGGTNIITTYSPPSLNSAYVSENGNGDPELPYDPFGYGVNAYGGYWGAGGGVSAYFATPSYQQLVNTGSSFRTTPDVGMQVGGCPGGISEICSGSDSYVNVYIGGSVYGVIGTSVASPEFVGALALYIQSLGGTGIGNANTFLYSQGAAQTAGKGTFFNRNIPGYDGAYTNTTPSINYNYIVGNGTPKVRSLFGLTALPPAGAPQTPSNP